MIDNVMYLIRPPSKSSSNALLGALGIIFLIGFIFRYFYLSYFINNNLSFMEIAPDWEAILPQSLRQSFAICCLIFAVIFLTGPIYKLKSVVSTHKYSSIDHIFIILLLVYSLFCLVMRHLYGGLMGEAESHMPLNLGPIVNRSIADIIPALLVLVIEVSWGLRSKWEYRLWVGILAVFCFVSAALLTSKAGLINFAVLYILFLYFSGQNFLKRPLLIISLAALAFISFLIGSELRSLSLQGSHSEYVTLLLDGEFTQMIFLLIGTLANRIIGLEGYALSCYTTCASLPEFITPSLEDFWGEAGRIFTQDVIGVKSDVDFRSPGLLGGAALIFGTVGGAIISILFIHACLFICRSIDSRPNSIALKVAFIYALIRFILEGTWASQSLISGLVGCIIVEFVARKIFKPLAQ